MRKIATKLSTLTKIAPHLNHNHVRLIYNSFFKWQLGYGPSMWTCCCRSSNCLINKLQERALITYSDHSSSFSELLEMANESTIHIRSLKFLFTEAYKFLNVLSPLKMNEVFQINDCPNDLGNPRILASRHNHNIKYSIDTIAFKIPQFVKKFL